MKNRKIILIIIFLVISTSLIFSSWTSEIEISRVYGGYSDIRIPNNKGDLISLTDDIDMESIFTYRIMFSKKFYKKHTIFLTYAPLKIKSEGVLPRDIYYNDRLFNKGSKVESEYVFNSYRITYRYKIYDSDKINLGLGLTAKIRDAYISLNEIKSSGYSKKSNVGFVPIVHFKFEYSINQNFNFNFTGDALASPYGRAEDIFTGFYYKFDNNFSIKAGYRFLEGGSDVEEVYSFSYFHYIVGGAKISF